MIFVLLAMLLSAIPDELLELRALYGRVAREDLLVFAQLNTPQPGAPEDPTQSRYQWKAHHRLLADELAALARGECQALEVETPPRYGKTEMAVRNFVPWHVGTFPDRDLIVITATSELAEEHGRDVRDYCRGPGFRLTFGDDPRTELREDSQSMKRLQFAGGARVHFYGRGQLPAGVGGHGLIFDDFFKSAEQAYSAAERANAWRSYVADCLSRLNNAQAWRLIIGSRKHEDDVQGRLFDPHNPHYDAASAAQFRRVRLPALSEGPECDPLGRPRDEVCWPERFPKSFYLAKRSHASPAVRLDFQTQDQCNPVGEEGNYFKKDWLEWYEPHELPKQLRKYCASDHAVRRGQEHDRNCLLAVGIDPADRIFILPDSYWGRCETDELVERMLDLMAAHQPLVWFALRDAISGSIGPFLRKRQQERKLYTYVDDSIREDTDLVRRARSIQGRFAMKMVWLPRAWERANDFEAELLAFPNGRHDDAVAALACLGMGLDRLQAAEGPAAAGAPKKGTFAALLEESRRKREAEARRAGRRGW